jgi:hypothetical protein
LLPTRHEGKSAPSYAVLRPKTAYLSSKFGAASCMG